MCALQDFPRAGLPLKSSLVLPIVLMHAYCMHDRTAIHRASRCGSKQAHQIFEYNPLLRDWILACSVRTLLDVLQGSADEDPLGNPYGFTNVPLPRPTPSYPLLVTTQMSRERSVKQLIFMSEGGYLSTDTGNMALRLVLYNADAKSLAYVHYTFQWQESGVIVGRPPLILALPVLAYSTYASDRYV